MTATLLGRLLPSSVVVPESVLLILVADLRRGEVQQLLDHFYGILTLEESSLDLVDLVFFDLASWQRSTLQ